MFVYTADLAKNIRRAPEFGINAAVESIDWPAIRERVMGRIEETSARGRKSRAESAHVALFEGRARFVGPHELVIDDDVHIEADQIVVAVGGRPSIPSVIARSGVEFHTSDTVMWIDDLPSSLVILGGGAVAVEFAHVFSSLGVDVTIVTSAPRLLEMLDEEVSKRFTAKVNDRWNVHVASPVVRCDASLRGITLGIEGGSEVSGELLLVATGRQPNTEDLGFDVAGVARRPDGHIVVDAYGRAAPHVWALGDVSSPFELKHVANAEARTISHNLTHPDDLRLLPHEWVPFAVFTDPQIASVGARSQDLEGRPYIEATQNYGDTAYGWALEDNDGICKIYADLETGLLLGAHVLGEQASLLITPLVQAMAHGQRVADLARGQYWVHPALSEVVENALLKLPLPRDVRSGQVH
jgi:mycothione reductase